jgi:Holliday junction resolvase RusA-like endonuclease
MDYTLHATGIDTMGELASIKSEIISLFRQSLEALITCGQKLSQVRNVLVDERQFKGFCMALPFTTRSAYNYMRLYEHSISLGIDTILASKIDATTWYAIPNHSEAARVALEQAGQGKKIDKDTARAIVQSLETSPQTKVALEQVATSNPRHFADMVERGMVTDPLSGDDIPLGGADPSMVAYASMDDESERIHRKQGHIEQSKQKRFAESVTFRIDTHPIPKERVYVTRYGAHTRDRTAAWEQEIALHARQAMAGRNPFAGDVALSVKFYREGSRRADLSNLIKAIEDGMNEVVYQDDSQIIEYGYCRVFYNSDQPGVEITVSRLAQSMDLVA